MNATTNFERRIEFDPAFDKRSTDPRKNCGIHGLTMRFVLKGPRGATQFVLYTSWQLPHVTKELMARQYETVGGDPHWMERPMPADLGYHSPVPQYEGQDVMSENCHILGGPCYYDGSSLNAEPVFHRLLTEGDAGVWEALEEYYRRVFETEPMAVSR